MYFQLHQPWRLKWFWPGDPYDNRERYFDYPLTRSIFEKVASRCYFPATQLLLDMVREHDFKFSLSITGTLIEQCELWEPKLIKLFEELISTEKVELLGETYYHSLSSLFEDRAEFRDEIEEHRNALLKLGYEPTGFRNTELIYNNSIASFAREMGYRSIMTEGVGWVLGNRSPNHVYKAKGSNIRVLPRNYMLSDDIGYRFSAKWWSEYPLTATKWAQWVAECEGDVVFVFIDYETFGEHHPQHTGILDFLRHLPTELERAGVSCLTPSEVVEEYAPVGEIDVPEFSTISWADSERDVSAWLGNEMQRMCFEEAKLLRPYVIESVPEFVWMWRRLLTSDHLYYMSTKALSDGDVHAYFSTYPSPFDAALNYMACVCDLKAKVFREKAAEKQRKAERMK
ncbi:MAG: alpha-amylase [Deltaproteobacteria bacterium]|nr:MAG: alpha-amylase [Deltaproteobacteria bacterium]